MRTVIYITFLLFVGLIELNARPEQEEVMMRAQYSAIFWGDDLERDGNGKWIAPELYIFSDESYQLLEPYANQLGRIKTYLGPRQMSVYTRITQADGTFGYQQIDKVELPQSDALLFFITSQSSGGYSVAAIDTSEKAIPPSGIAFLNLTTKEIAANIRGDQQRVKPRSAALFKPHFSEQPDLSLKVAVYDGEWEQAFATVTRISQNRSYLMVFYLQGNREGAYRLRIFRNLQQLRES